MPNKISLVEQNSISIGDIASICVCDGEENSIKNIQLLNINKEESKLYHLKIIDVVKKIKDKFQDVEIINLGQQEIIIDYKNVPSKENDFINNLKIFFVCLILFAGGITTIMAFHIETELLSVLERSYTFFTGEEIKNMALVSVPYSLGIGSGIMLFFNHVGNKKITNDPTPVEIELSKYEQDILNTIADKLTSQEKEQC